jgi:hypothetical protein
MVATIIIFVLFCSACAYLIFAKHSNVDAYQRTFDLQREGAHWGKLDESLYANEANDEKTREDRELLSEIEWRKDVRKHSFSHGDIVSFYETDNDRHIWKGYMIVDSFAIKNLTVNVIPQLLYTSKGDKVMMSNQAKMYSLELINKDMYYDATKEEINMFIEQIRATGRGAQFIKMLEERRDSIKGDGTKWVHESVEDKYLNE